MLRKILVCLPSLVILLFCLTSTCSATKVITLGLSSSTDAQPSLQVSSPLKNPKEQKIKNDVPTLAIKNFVPEWVTPFLQVITNPTIAYLLLLVGLYGILFELLYPGFLIPGVLGTLTLLLAFFVLQFFPINLTALGLIILGIAFIVSEAFAPSYGVLGFGGTLTFIIGSFFLIDTNLNGYQIARPVLWVMALLNSIILLFLAGVLFKTGRSKIEHGVETLIGAQGRTLETINLNGQAVIKGEIWNVQTKQVIAANKPIRVFATHGLYLEVEEIEDR